MKKFLFSLIFLAMASTASAQEDSVSFDFGEDRFLSGSDVALNTEGRDDVFMAGETLNMTSDISGTAHAMGRVVSLEGDIGQDAYAAGYKVTLSGAVAGDATLMGYEVWLGEALGGDLRTTGARVTIDAPVGGYALVAGETVTLNSTVAGDVSIAAETLVFGPEARILGKLTLYEREESPNEVPASVVSADRIERHPVEDWEKIEGGKYAPFSLKQAASSFIYGVITISIFAGLIAAIAPRHLTSMRERLLEAPLRTTWFGFLSLSLLIGSAIVLAMTLIGIVIAPVALGLALLGAFLGYVIGAYALGVGLLLAIGRNVPDGWVERVVAAFVGALVVGLIGLVPFIGWIFVFAVTLAGVGALATRMFRPTFFTIV